VAITIPDDDAGGTVDVDAGATEEDAAPAKPDAEVRADASAIEQDAGSDASVDPDAHVSLGARRLAVGDHHACAVVGSGSVVCWGDNTAGQVTGAGVASGGAPPTIVPRVSTAVGVFVGPTTSCALLSGGTVNCWGRDLVVGSGIRAASSGAMAGLSGVASIAVGDVHACAVKSDGSVVCWGNSGMSQLGGGAAPGPVAVASVAGASQVASGRFGSCARLDSGEVKCWGYLIDSGWDAANARPKTVTPRTVFPGGMADVSAGESAICGSTSAGAVQCIGSGFLLGAGRTDSDTVLTPTTAQGVSQSTMVAVYSSHACSVSGGSVYCWGSAPMTATPTKVPGLSGVTSVGVGRAYTCALVDTGDVMCWGENNQGELGDPTLATTATPVRVLLPEL